MKAKRCRRCSLLIISLLISVCSINSHAQRLKGTLSRDGTYTDWQTGETSTAEERCQKAYEDGVNKAIETARKTQQYCDKKAAFNSSDPTPNEVGVCVSPDGTVSKPTIGTKGNVPIINCPPGSTFVHTHGMEKWKDSDGYEHITALGLSGADIKAAIDGKINIIAVDCQSGINTGVGPDGKVYLWDGKRKELDAPVQYKVTIDGKLQVLDFSQDIANERFQKETGRSANGSASREGEVFVGTTQSGIVNTDYAFNLPNSESTDSGLLNNDALHSLADLLETGEEIVEVREDMREDRHERKAREQAERERKAAEDAERLRQQQEDQRRKAQSETRKPDKSRDAKTPTQTTQKKPTQTTKQPEPSPQPPAERSESIDFSRLNGIVDSQISLVRGILSAGEKVSDAQKARFNSLNSQYKAEFDRLKSQIANVSDAAKRSEYYNKLASINNRISSELDPLLAQGQSRGLFVNL